MISVHRYIITIVLLVFLIAGLFFLLVGALYSQPPPPSVSFASMPQQVKKHAFVLRQTCFKNSTCTL